MKQYVQKHNCHHMFLIYTWCMFVGGEIEMSCSSDRAMMVMAVECLPVLVSEGN